jgi:hypothetical protein
VFLQEKGNGERKGGRGHSSFYSQGQRFEIKHSQEKENKEKSYKGYQFRYINYSFWANVHRN